MSAAIERVADMDPRHSGRRMSIMDTAQAIALRRMIAKAGRDLEEMIRAAEASMGSR